jgi:hypothetical protein
MNASCNCKHATKRNVIFQHPVALENLIRTGKYQQQGFKIDLAGNIVEVPTNIDL